MRNCRGDFQWDNATRRFIKKIQARKFVEPPKLHLELGKFSVTKIIDGKLFHLTQDELEKELSRKK